MAISTAAPRNLPDPNPTSAEVSTNTADREAIPAPPPFIDDRSPRCVPFILSRLLAYQKNQPPGSQRPFIIGLNGVQGAGKTTVVATLAETLKVQEGLETLVLSIDDLYLKHEDQVKLAEEQKGNKLLQHRGEPGTHDIALARSVLASLLLGNETAIPAYNKALHSGLGDRMPASTFRHVNTPSSPHISVIILEGWLVGFRNLSEFVIEQRYSAPSVTLKDHKLEHLLFVNEKLKEYDVLTNEFDAFIHIDAQETAWVYEWREEQEAALRKRGEGGMSKEQVKIFVDGYYPAYELYVDGVRNGVLNKTVGSQLRLVVGRDRKVLSVIGI